jgi:hypothetical protein
MKLIVLSTLISATLFSPLGCADATLKSCSAKKIQQMEITRRAHNGSVSSKKSGGHSKRSSSSSPQLKADQIDEWLWKNCRSYSEEMRSIEQQYM